MQNKKYYKIYEEANIFSKINDKFEIITLMYEKLIKNFLEIEKAIKTDDILIKIKKINNSIDIINELINSLDFQQGDIAHYLYGIYNDLNRRLLKVNAENNLKELEIVKNVINEMFKQWQKEIRLVRSV